MANLSGKDVAGIGPTGGADVRVYGGVVNDFRWVEEQVERTFSTEYLGPVNFLMAGYFGFIDLPLSFVGDTLTLPTVIGSWRESGSQGGEASRNQSPQPTGAAKPDSEQSRLLEPAPPAGLGR
jgi:hypothetical protein